MLVLAIVGWVNLPMLIVAAGVELVRHEWGWAAVLAAQVPLNRWAANYFWRRRVRGDR
jgi:hypothetical protein